MNSLKFADDQAVIAKQQRFRMYGSKMNTQKTKYPSTGCNVQNLSSWRILRKHKLYVFMYNIRARILKGYKTLEWSKRMTGQRTFYVYNTVIISNGAETSRLTGTKKMAQTIYVDDFRRFAYKRRRMETDGNRRAY